jgi:predicted nucleic acid-binding Zn ribbon protein
MTPEERGLAGEHGSTNERDPAGERDEAIAVFARFRRVFGDGAGRSADARKRAKKEPGSSVPFGGGRDPEELGTVIDGLAAKLGWNSPLAQADLLSSWADIAGEETAKHSTPIGMDDGLLTVRCDSTAWATQLRLMRVEIATKIAQRHPDAGIEQVRFEGPNAPSWKKGPRTIPGRGPRDTYG